MRCEQISPEETHGRFVHWEKSEWELVPQGPVLGPVLFTDTVSLGQVAVSWVKSSG